MVKRQRCRLYQNKNLTKEQGFSLGGWECRCGGAGTRQYFPGGAGVDKDRRMMYNGGHPRKARRRERRCEAFYWCATATYAGAPWLPR